MLYYMINRSCNVRTLQGLTVMNVNITFFLKYEAVQSSRWVPMFRMNLLLPYLGQKKWKISFTVKIMAAGAFETLMPLCQIMKHHIAKDHNIKTTDIISPCYILCAVSVILCMWLQDSGLLRLYLPLQLCSYLVLNYTVYYQYVGSSATPVTLRCIEQVLCCLTLSTVHHLFKHVYLPDDKSLNFLYFTATNYVRVPIY